MQRKTITKIITKKLDEFIQSISETNPELAKDVKPNILLSGGSIASLFMQKDVNDFDIYIQDMDVLVRLANHYTKDYHEISVLDGRKKQSYVDEFKYTNGINKVIVENLKEDQVKLMFEYKNGGVAVANDDEEYDNLSNKTNASSIIRAKNKNEEGKPKNKYVPSYFSPNAISLTDKIQIVLRFHGDSKAIHKTFDFVHATNYFTYKEGLVTNIKALESILTKQLFYQGSLYPLTSIIRMKKFLLRGWKISAGEILKIMYQISCLDLSDINTLEEQLIGVDVAYFSALIELIRNGEYNEYKDQYGYQSYLIMLIDKVFNDFDDDRDEEIKAIVEEDATSQVDEIADVIIPGESYDE